MLKIYGSMLCKDCVQCVADLKQANVAFEFYDFGDNLANLKNFLSIRDNSALFDDARREGYIGIPCLVTEAGDVTLDWSEYVTQANA